MANEPNHHVRYRRAWDLYRDEGNSPETLKALEREMDDAQNEFDYEEFREFKVTLPGYVEFWKNWEERVIADAREELITKVESRYSAMDRAQEQRLKCEAARREAEEKCTCNRRYISPCTECAPSRECDYCNNTGYKEISEAEYMVDKNTERPLDIIHEPRCRFAGRRRRRRFDNQ